MAKSNDLSSIKRSRTWASTPICRIRSLRKKRVRMFCRRGHRTRLRVFLLALVLTGLGLARPALTQSNASVEARRREFTQRLVAAAVERTHHVVRYDPAYVPIPYPGGDVPADTGVCTDEIIRTYRSVGVDLQKEVHEDMVQNFAAYPNQRRWGLAHTDANIDHRRVPNLMVFFSRKGESLPTTTHPEDFAPGDLVTWDLGGGVPHIGMVVDTKSSTTGR